MAFLCENDARLRREGKRWKLLMHVSCSSLPPETPRSLPQCRACAWDRRRRWTEVKSDALKRLSSCALGKMELAVICICNSRTWATLTERKGSLWWHTHTHTHALRNTCMFLCCYTNEDLPPALSNPQCWLLNQIKPEPWSVTSKINHSWRHNLQ